MQEDIGLPFKKEKNTFFQRINIVGAPFATENFKKTHVRNLNNYFYITVAISYLNN